MLLRPCMYLALCLFSAHLYSFVTPQTLLGPAGPPTLARPLDTAKTVSAPSPQTQPRVLPTTETRFDPDSFINGILGQKDFILPKEIINKIFGRFRRVPATKNENFAPNFIFSLRDFGYRRFYLKILGVDLMSIVPFSLQVHLKVILVELMKIDSPLQSVKALQAIFKSKHLDRLICHSHAEHYINGLRLELKPLSLNPKSLARMTQFEKYIRHYTNKNDQNCLNKQVLPDDGFPTKFHQCTFEEKHYSATLSTVCKTYLKVAREVLAAEAIKAKNSLLQNQTRKVSTEPQVSSNFSSTPTFGATANNLNRQNKNNLNLNNQDKDVPTQTLNNQTTVDADKTSGSTTLEDTPSNPEMVPLSTGSSSKKVVIVATAAGAAAGLALILGVFIHLRRKNATKTPASAPDRPLTELRRTFSAPMTASMYGVGSVASVPKDAEPQTVHVPYEPRMEDELRLMEGDEVIVLETFEDGYAYGTNQRNERGIFPVMCLTSPYDRPFSAITDTSVIKNSHETFITPNTGRYTEYSESGYL